MNLPPGQLPDQPGSHGTEENISLFCPFPDTGHIFQNPPDFGAGKIGIDDKAGFAADGIHQPFRCQSIAVVGSPAALPDNGVVYRLAGALIPTDCGFPLVGYSDGGNIRRGGADGIHCLPGNLQLGGKDFFGIMLHPAGVRKDLGKLLLRHRADLPVFVKKDRPVGGGAGIQSHNVFGHCHLPFSRM